MYDIFIDGEKASEWYKSMMDASAVLGNNVDSIYKEIGNMNEGWGGSSYDLFKADADSQRKYFDSIADLVDVYKDGIINQFIPLVDDKIAEIAAAVDNLR